MQCALTIAGSDSSGGAGLQADLRVFADVGVYGLTAVTSVTVQDSTGVLKIAKVTPRIVAAQIDSAVRDVVLGACKIGMMYSPQVVSTVAKRIDRRGIANIVLDPVISASDGTPLILHRGVERMIRELLPLVTIVTPNLREAQILSGIQVMDTESAREAARAIHALGPKHVLIKGGHSEADPLDLLYNGDIYTEFPGERVQGIAMHGTGCVLSAAIAARLAIGDSVQDAVGFAKEYVGCAIRSSVRLGKGDYHYYVGTRRHSGVREDSV